MGGLERTAWTWWTIDSVDLDVSGLLGLPGPQGLPRSHKQNIRKWSTGLLRRFILFYMFVGNALCGVPNSPYNDRLAVPYAI